MSMRMSVAEMAGMETEEFKEECIIQALTCAVKNLPRMNSDSNSYAMELLINRARSVLEDYMEMCGYNPEQIIEHFERERLN